jgi:hypothetical protein
LHPDEDMKHEYSPTHHDLKEKVSTGEKLQKIEE